MGSQGHARAAGRRRHGLRRRLHGHRDHGAAARLSGVEPGMERQSSRLGLPRLRAAGAQPRELPVGVHKRARVRRVHLRQPGRAGPERALLAQECRAARRAGDLLRVGDVNIAGSPPRHHRHRRRRQRRAPPRRRPSWQGAADHAAARAAATAAVPAASRRQGDADHAAARRRRRRRARLAGQADDAARRRPRPAVGAADRSPGLRLPQLRSARARPSCAATPAGTSPTAARSPTYAGRAGPARALLAQALVSPRTPQRLLSFGREMRKEETTHVTTQGED